MEKSPIFEKIYRDYLARVAGLNLIGKQDLLGIRISGDGIHIPFFQSEFRVSPDGIADETGHQPLHAISVLLCRYLILCPDAEPVDGHDWVSYKDFKDAAPFVGGFGNNTEKAIAKNFSGKSDALARACRKLGGADARDGFTYDLCMKIRTLPKIELYLLFNDADEEFPADCRVLFERRAAKYLDMECLAIAGWLFSDYLMQVCGKAQPTIM